MWRIIIKNAGIGNFIATNDEDYFEKAVYYSSNINELNKVRKTLFEQIQKSPLFDTKLFTNDFCKGLEEMMIEINKNYK